MAETDGVTWETLDWSVLERLRAGFLTGSAASGPYWQSLDDLAHYDFTYAERIGWKWDHVLDELRRRGWSPPTGTLLDWGCGSGIAHRRMIARWPEQIDDLQVFDHSTLAERYALEQVAQRHPALPARSFDRTSPVTTVVISHVLNELDEDSSEELMSIIMAAEAVVWIEPGTSEVAHRLVAWRERVREHFRFVYPCPHQGSCGLLQAARKDDWCHHFAAPPAGVFADSHWVKFGQRAGIDLRSLPYSALVMEKPSRPSAVATEAMGRIIGRPRVSKPYTRLLGCDERGVELLELPKKVAPQLAKKLDRATSPRLFQWNHSGGKVTQISPVIPAE